MKVEFYNADCMLFSFECDRFYETETDVVLVCGSHHKRLPKSKFLYYEVFKVGDNNGKC